MAYENQCGSCIHYEEEKPNRLKKSFCDWYGCYYYPDDTCVGDGDHYRYRGYVTTMVCDRLGLDKTKEVYDKITGFQKNVMENDKKYETTLRDYNVIGPKIASHLATEDIDVVKKVYGIFLVPVAKLIDEKKYDQAVFKYKHMLEILKAHYNISSKKTTENKIKVLAVKKSI